MVQRSSASSASPSCSGGAEMVKVAEAPRCAVQARKWRASRREAGPVVSQVLMCSWVQPASVRSWSVEPVEEGHSGGDLVAGVADRGAPGRGDTCCSPSQAAHGLPCGEGVHQPSMLGVVDPGDGGGDPLFEPGDGLVAFGQGAMGDEELADVAGRSRPGMGIERVVGQRHRARRQRGEDRGAGTLTQPVERGERRVGGGDGVTHGDESGGDVAVGTGEQHGDTASERAVGAAAPLEQPVLTAAMRTGRLRRRARRSHSSASRSDREVTPGGAHGCSDRNCPRRVSAAR